MVNAISVEIFAHVLEAANPPLTTIGEHLVPVVGGEAPVLTIGAESIGWSTCLTIHVEVVWLYPCIATIGADADGNVALQNHVLATGILVSCLHLLAEFKLNKHPECSLLAHSAGGVLNALLKRWSKLAMVGPLLEVGSTKLIA